MMSIKNDQFRTIKKKKKKKKNIIKKKKKRHYEMKIWNWNLYFFKLKRFHRISLLSYYKKKNKKTFL